MLIILFYDMLEYTIDELWNVSPTKIINEFWNVSLTKIIDELGDVRLTKI